MPFRYGRTRVKMSPRGEGTGFITRCDARPFQALGPLGLHHRPTRTPEGRQADWLEGSEASLARRKAWAHYLLASFDPTQ